MTQSLAEPSLPTWLQHGPHSAVKIVLAPTPPLFPRQSTLNVTAERLHREDCWNRLQGHCSLLVVFKVGTKACRAVPEDGEGNRGVRG